MGPVSVSSGNPWDLNILLWWRRRRGQVGPGERAIICIINYEIKVGALKMLNKHTKHIENNYSHVNLNRGYKAISYKWRIFQHKKLRAH